MVRSVGTVHPIKRLAPAVGSVRVNIAGDALESVLMIVDGISDFSRLRSVEVINDHTVVQAVERDGSGILFREYIARRPFKGVSVVIDSAGCFGLARGVEVVLFSRIVIVEERALIVVRS